jgi:hypothetical protein
VRMGPSCLDFFMPIIRKEFETSFTRLRFLIGDSYMIAKSLDHTPVRILLIYDIDSAWISRHFSEVEVNMVDVQEWLNRRF